MIYVYCYWWCGLWTYICICLCRSDTFGGKTSVIRLIVTALLAILLWPAAPILCFEIDRKRARDWRGKK